MPRIIAVLEHLLNDTDAMFLIDVEAIDSTDHEQVAYCDAIEASIEYQVANHETINWDEFNKTQVKVCYSYESVAWKNLERKAPCIIAAVAEIWETDE